MKTAKDTNSPLETAKTYSRRSFKGLWQIVQKYSGDFSKKASSGTKENKSKQLRKKSLSLKILRVIPGILMALFITSFLWDFNDLSYRLLSHTFRFEGLLRILSVGGLIGFGTNWLAITMLFKPVEKHPLLGHGLIPAQKKGISTRLAQAVADDLINPEIIKQKIHDSDAISRYRKYSTRYIKTVIDDPDFRRELKMWAVQYVDDMIANPEIRSAIAEKILIQIESSIEKKTLEKAALRAYTFIKGQKCSRLLKKR